MKESWKRYINLMLVLFGALALGICLFFILFYMDKIRSGFYAIVGILMPFIYGAVIAYILKPVCNVLERKFIRIFSGNNEKNIEKAKKIAAPLSVTAAMLIGFAVVAALLMMVIPHILTSISSLTVVIQNGIDNFADWINALVGEQSVISNYVEELSDGISDKLSGWLQKDLMPNLQMIVNGVTSGVASLVSIVMNLLIGVIVAIYLLNSRKQFAAQGKLVLYSVFREKWADAIIHEIQYADRMFCGFINGKLLDSAIIGLICFVFTWVTHMPYGLLVSVIVGVTNIIPFFGPYMGAVPSALLILMVDPVKCVIFLVFIVILQQFDGNILGPKILGNVTGLSSFWVLFAILAFGGVFGFVGMIIGVPVFAVIYDIIKKLIHRGLNRRNQLKRLEAYNAEYPDDEEKDKKDKKNAR